MTFHAPDKPVSSSKRALMQLRDMIFSGDLPAGSDHLESELANRLDMSRTPVREAILTLESQGLLELRPRRGVRISPISPTDMAEIYDVLTELESHAAGQAASFDYAPEALQTLEQTLNDMDRAIINKDLDAWAAADDRFHAELVQLGRNSRIITIFATLNDQVRRARATTLTMRPLPTKSNQDHRKVFEAIKVGDADKAIELHRAHRKHAKQIIVGILEKYRLRFV